MSENEAAEHRSNIRRYRYLLEYLRDPDMREKLKKLLEEAEERLRQIDTDRRS